MNVLWLLPLLLLCGIGGNDADAFLCAKVECDFKSMREDACAKETAKAFSNKKTCAGHCYMAETRDLTSLLGNPKGMVALRSYGCLLTPEYEFHKAAKPFAPGLAGGTAKYTFDSKEYYIDICHSGEYDCQRKNITKFKGKVAEVRKVGVPGQRTCVQQNCNLRTFTQTTCTQTTCLGDYCFKFDTYNNAFAMAFYQPLLTSGCISGQTPSIKLGPYDLSVKPFTDQNKCESMKYSDALFHLNICNTGDFCNVCDSYTEVQVVFNGANGVATVTILLMALTTVTIVLNILKYI